MLLPGRLQAGFPEFDFCPLGGPTGWINRLTGEHNKRRYYYPPYYTPAVLYPPLVPGTWQAPVNSYPENIPAGRPGN